MADLVKNGEPSHRPGSAVLPPKEGTIPLYLVNGVATVWDAQVAATIHCVHNVSGLRAGTLPGVAQQNGFLGLPLTLTKEEAAYLVQEGIAHLIPLPTFPPIPTPAEIAAHTVARQARIGRLEALARAQDAARQAEAAQRFAKGGEKAMAKREARARARLDKERAKKADQGIFGGQSNEEADGEASREGGAEPATTTTVDAINPDRSEVEASPAKPADVRTGSSPAPVQSAKKQSVSAIANPSAGEPSIGHFHAIPSHPSHPSLHTSEAITSLPHPLYPFPSTPRDRALVGVFSELQRRGLRLGLGPRFGGEYLIYPGDYLRYHAHFTSQILVRDEPIRPAELVAWGRLGTGTKKAGLICTWDDGVRTSTQVEGHEEGKGEIEFYSLEWANFG